MSSILILLVNIITLTTKGSYQFVRSTVCIEITIIVYYVSRWVRNSYEIQQSARAFSWVDASHAQFIISYNSPPALGSRISQTFNGQRFSTLIHARNSTPLIFRKLIKVYHKIGIISRRNPGKTTERVCALTSSDFFNYGYWTRVLGNREYPDVHAGLRV